MRRGLIGVSFVLLVVVLVGCRSVLTNTQMREMGVVTGEEQIKITGTADEVTRLSLVGDFSKEILELKLQKTVVTRESYQSIRARNRQTKVSTASGPAEMKKVRLAAEMGLEKEPGNYYLSEVQHVLYEDPQFRLFLGSAAENSRLVDIKVWIRRDPVERLVEEKERILNTVQQPGSGATLTLTLAKSGAQLHVTLDDRGHARVDLRSLLSRHAAALKGGWVHPAILVSGEYAGQKLERTLNPLPSVLLKYQKQSQAQPLIQFCEKMAGELLESVGKKQKRIVVLDLPMKSGETRKLGVEVGRWVGQALRSSSKVEALVERDAVSGALKAGGFEGAVDRQGARSIGQHLQATAVLIGTITAKGGKYEVQMTLFSCADDIDIVSKKLILEGGSHVDMLHKQALK